MAARIGVHQHAVIRSIRVANQRPVPSSYSSRCMRFAYDKPRRTLVAYATPEEEREIEEMKKAASSGSIMDSEVFSIALKVAVVATFVAVTVGILKIGEPVLDAIVQAFPITAPPQ